jgi:hypothetical protein
VGYGDVEDKGDTNPRRASFLKSLSGRFQCTRSSHHGPLAKMHRVSGLRCSGEREIDIDVVAAFPAEEAAAADFLGSPMQHHLLSSRFRLTSKCPRTETINIPEPQP